MDNQSYVQQPYTPPQPAQPQAQPPLQPYAPADGMTVGAWIGTLILTCIPLVNIICLIVWAASSNPAKRSRKNWAIAQIILMVIAIVLTVVLTSVLGASLADMMY